MIQERNELRRGCCQLTVREEGALETGSGWGAVSLRGAAAALSSPGWAPERGERCGRVLEREGAIFNF